MNHEPTSHAGGEGGTGGVRCSCGWEMSTHRGHKTHRRITMAMVWTAYREHWAAMNPGAVIPSPPPDPATAVHLFDPTPYQPHSDTSREAAQRIEPRAGTLRATVLDFIRATGPITDEDIQEALGMAESTQRPRRVELVRAGLVRDSGKRDRTSTGRRAVMWEAL